MALLDEDQITKLMDLLEIPEEKRKFWGDAGSNPKVENLLPIQDWQHPGENLEQSRPSASCWKHCWEFDTQGFEDVWRNQSILQRNTGLSNGQTNVLVEKI